MMSVSTYNAESLIYTGRLAERAKSAHGHASRKRASLRLPSIIRY